MPEYKTIEIKDLKSYAIIFLNRPDNLNSLNFQLAEDLYSALDYISNNKKYRGLFKFEALLQIAIYSPKSGDYFGEVPPGFDISILKLNYVKC